MAKFMFSMFLGHHLCCWNMMDALDGFIDGMDALLGWIDGMDGLDGLIKDCVVCADMKSVASADKTSFV